MLLLSMLNILSYMNYMLLHGKFSSLSFLLSYSWDEMKLYSSYFICFPDFYLTLFSSTIVPHHTTCKTLFHLLLLSQLENLFHKVHDNFSSSYFGILLRHLTFFYQLRDTKLIEKGKTIETFVFLLCASQLQSIFFYSFENLWCGYCCYDFEKWMKSSWVSDLMSQSRCRRITIKFDILRISVKNL